MKVLLMNANGPLLNLLRTDRKQKKLQRHHPNVLSFISI